MQLQSLVFYLLWFDARRYFYEFILIYHKTKNQFIEKDFSIIKDDKIYLLQRYL